jgi:hypothetical protein
MKRSIPISVVFVTLVTFVCFAVPSVHAYSSNICAGSTCTSGEVGDFMAGISKECGNTGDCSVNDILLVFINVGNYIVGIIGAVVLLMYIIGGFLLLASAGKAEWVKRGWSFIKTSTFGLLIVMFSFIAVYSLRGVLQYGNVSATGEVSICEQTHPDIVSMQNDYKEIFTKIQYFDCVDVDTLPTSDNGQTNRWYTPNTCIPNQCPGDDSVQCCQVDYFY